MPGKPAILLTIKLKGAPMIFLDRRAGGEALASLLVKYARRDDVIVLALPRGGVPLAETIADRLGVALDVFIVRKLGVPGQPELAMGAIASGGIRVLDPDIVRALHISRSVIDTIARHKQEELTRREYLYRGSRPEPELKDKTVILVDDGLATGSSIHSAIAAVRLQHPASIIVAVPAAARQTCEALQQLADEVVCAATPFFAVGQWYEGFDQTSDEEVHRILERSRTRDRSVA